MKKFEKFIGIISVIMLCFCIWHPSLHAFASFAMLYVPSVGFADFSKKAGSVVASKNHFGGYLRHWVKPINPKSSSQTAQRAGLRSFSQAFKSITPAQVLAWNSLAKNLSKIGRLGWKGNPTGQNAYMSANLNINSAGGTAITDAPSVDANSVPFLAGVIITCITGAISMAYTAGTVASNIVEVSASGALSSGRTYNSNFRKIATFASNAVSPFVLTASWVAIFGTAPAAGQVVFFKVRVIDKLTGFASGWEKFRVAAA
jgi:hypothetical protein